MKVPDQGRAGGAHQRAEHVHLDAVRVHDVGAESGDRRAQLLDVPQGGEAAADRVPREPRPGCRRHEPGIAEPSEVARERQRGRGHAKCAGIVDERTVVAADQADRPRRTRLPHHGQQVEQHPLGAPHGGSRRQIEEAHGRSIS